MATQELGGGINRDVNAVIERTEQNRRENGVVHKDRKLVGVGDIADNLKVRHVVFGIADGFQKHEAGVLVDKLMDLFGMVRVEEPYFDTQLAECLCEKGPGASVKAGRGDDILPGVRNR